MLDFLQKLFGKTPRRGAPLAEPLQEQTLDSIHESEEHFHHLVAGVKDYAIFLLDANGNVISWNAGAERIKGYRADEVIGQQFSRFYPPDRIASNWPEYELEQARITGRFEDENWRVRKDGTQFWANVVITAFRDHTGKVRGFLKITRDLTERKQAEKNALRLLEEESTRRLAENRMLDALRAEQEARRHREQLRVTLSSIGDAVIATDMRGAVTFMNPVAEELTGWGSDEAAGQPLGQVFSIVNEETRLPVENPVAKVLREGYTVGLANHTVLINRNGKETPIDDSAAPIRGEGDALEGVVLVFRDVTEIRRAAEARQHLAAIVESTEDAIISKNLDGTVLSWNEGAERLYGYTAGEMLGRSLAILLPPEHSDELPDILNRLGQGERFSRLETQRMRKDGSRIEVALTISPIKNVDGKIIGASTIARDITARRQEEGSLRFLAEASKALGELLDVPSTLQRVAAICVPYFADWCAVHILDGTGTLQRVAVAHVDPTKVQLAHEVYRRYPPAPSSSPGIWSVLRSGKSELLSEIPQAMIKERVKDQETLQMARSLGLKSYVGVPLTVRGKTIGVLTFMSAESGRRYTPADVGLAEELSRRAGLAIENAQLYTELQDADRRKDEFMAMLAHELRNPLAPIRNALHIMKQPGTDAAMTGRARQMAERQVEHMVRLVDDLLDVTRIVRGQVELRKERVELAQVISRAVETAQPDIDAKGHELILSVPPEPLMLEADPVRLAEVVTNLLNNAAKFSERAGKIWLTVEGDGADAVIRVRDEGIGISADLLPHVFDSFVQGDRSLERTQGGLGVGLTVSRKLVELHGGSISARSHGIGKGSEFVVRLPGLQILLRSGSPAAQLPPVSAPGSHRILVAEDHYDAAESMEMMLRQWGNEVRVVHDGVKALQAVDEFRPDIVLLDIGLPGQNGYDVARQIRQKPEFRHVFLAAITGYGQMKDRRRSTEAGFDNHLTKPVDAAALRALIDGVGQTGRK
jgi:PAS domain S-box-containing protein